MINTKNYTDILIQKYGKETRWVNWRKEKDKMDKDTKVPYCSKIKKASSTNSKTWKTYDMCETAFNNGSNNFSGIGIVLHDSKLLCIDIDHVLEDGKVKHSQADVIQSLLKIANTFTEVSQSGTGLHLFFALTEPFTPIANKKAPFEIYSQGRFIATTGNSYHEIPLGVRTVDVEEMERILKVIGYPFGREKKEVGARKVSNQQTLTDEELLNKMFSSKNGHAIKSLYGGDISPYNNDDSSADMALCAHLAYWTGSDALQMERIWLASPLGQREKVRSREDYRERTITNSIKNYNEPHERKVVKKEADTKNSKKKRVEPIFKSSMVTGDALYEMVYDRSTSTTSFLKQPKIGDIEFSIDEVEINGQKYVPIPPTYDLLLKGVMLFPSTATPYKDEAEILAEIRTFIHKYVDVSEVFEQISTYYVLFTWMFDRFNEVPYLRALGDFGSGKSRFIQTTGILCYKPMFTGGATTPSPIFRIINEVQGTLIIDEADFKFSDMTSEIVKILNTGYQKGMPVLRSEGKGTFEVKAYDVFCPKIVATRETFSDKALESRFLVEEMGARKLRADIPRTIEEDFYQEAEHIRNKLLMWRFKNYFEPIKKRTEVIEGIHPRLNQIVIPLLSIIKDEDIRARLTTFIIKYNGELVSDRGLSWESDIVFAALRFEYENGKKEVTVGEIAKYANEGIDDFEDRLTPRKIGWYLRAKLQLKPYKTRKGFVLSFKENRDRLDMWKERFGITDADIRGEEAIDVGDADVANVVNVENVVNNIESADEAVNPQGFPFER